MRKQKKKEHKSPAHLYIKVIMGYILLSLLILGCLSASSSYLGIARTS